MQMYGNFGGFAQQNAFVWVGDPCSFLDPSSGGEFSQKRTNQRNARRISSANTARVRSWKVTAFAKTVPAAPFGEGSMGAYGSPRFPFFDVFFWRSFFWFQRAFSAKKV